MFLPLVPPWIQESHGERPAVSDACVHCFPPVMHPEPAAYPPQSGLESNDRSSAVTVCPVEPSACVHCTVSPTLTVTSRGLCSRLPMTTEALPPLAHPAPGKAGLQSTPAADLDTAV